MVALCAAAPAAAQGFPADDLTSCQASLTAPTLTPSQPVEVTVLFTPALARLDRTISRDGTLIGRTEDAILRSDTLLFTVELFSGYLSAFTDAAPTLGTYTESYFTPGSTAPACSWTLTLADDPVSVPNGPAPDDAASEPPTAARPSYTG